MSKNGEFYTKHLDVSLAGVNPDYYQDYSSENIYHCVYAYCRVIRNCSALECHQDAIVIRACKKEIRIMWNLNAKVVQAALITAKGAL